MELIKEIDREGFDIRIGYEYSQDAHISELCPELHITEKRLDGSSVKITPQGYPRSNHYTFWATNVNNNECFEQDVEMARKFFKDEITCYNLIVKVYKHGIKLHDESWLHNCYSEKYGEDLLEECKGYLDELISEAIESARDNIKKLTA